LEYSHKKEDLFAYGTMFERLASGRELGLAFDMDGERADGFLTPEEVLKLKYCLCLEHAYMVKAVAEEAGMKDVYLFKIFRDEQGGQIPHISNGVFIENSQYNEEILKRMSMELKKARITYYRFNEDSEFRSTLPMQETGEKRKSVFAQAGKKLLLLDFSLANFGAQYQDIRLMQTGEELLSAYFVDRGSYYWRKNQREMAFEDFSTALKINPNDELARSHMIAYHSNIMLEPERVIELSDDHKLLVNSEDFVNRALAFIFKGTISPAVISLARAIQLSEYAEKARALMKDIMKRLEKSGERS
jgi:hypothetical protein